MLIAIVSDTHNNKENFMTVLKEIEARGIRYLVHCGDLTQPDLLESYPGLQIFLAFGNGDLEKERILKKIKSLNPENICGERIDFVLDNQRIFVAHGDLPSVVQKAVLSGNYDWVLQGHTHRFKNEMAGQTHWLNPGSLGARFNQPKTYAVVNTSDRSVEKIELEEV